MSYKDTELVRITSYKTTIIPGKRKDGISILRGCTLEIFHLEVNELLTD